MMELELGHIHHQRTTATTATSLEVKTNGGPAAHSSRSYSRIETRAWLALQGGLRALRLRLKRRSEAHLVFVLSFPNYHHGATTAAVSNASEAVLTSATVAVARDATTICTSSEQKAEAVTESPLATDLTIPSVTLWDEPQHIRASICWYISSLCKRSASAECIQYPLLERQRNSHSQPSAVPT